MRRFVGTTPESLPSNRSRPIIQNLGPGVVYIDTTEEVTVDTGFQIPVGGAYEAPLSTADTQIWMVATETDTDVRVFGSTDTVNEEREIGNL